MVAIAFAYYNYTFSRLHFINFKEVVFYTGDSDIFVPTEEAYVVVFFSSLQSSSDQVITKLNTPKKYTVLMIDLAQSKQKSHDNIIYLTTGINTLLKTIKFFRVDHSPSALLIKQHKNYIYKQMSLIEPL